MKATLKNQKRWGRAGGLIGGKKTSRAKARAARLNGKKGGRPRKEVSP